MDTDSAAKDPDNLAKDPDNVADADADADAVADIDAAEAARLISRLNLQPHPEGGYYRETYRAEEAVHRPGLAVDRSAGTAIYYLLSGDAWSAWHRIKSDEIWHFYAGGPLLVHVLDGRGGLTTHRLGNAITDPGCVFQTVVAAGYWFAAERVRPDRYTLAGCTVAPGFEFSDFELADADRLAADYPAHRALVARLAPRKA
jgi:predicted cupin superfamily sugar epimerase